MLNSKILDYKPLPIALYGLSDETEKALSELESSNVAGLLDGYRENGELYGKPIISLEEAYRAGVRLIAVIARPGSCKAIADRIGGFCREKGITLLDSQGNDLLAPKEPLFTLDNLNLFTVDEVLSECEKHDIVSFDLFDTLVMRKVLNYPDIFFRIEEKLLKMGISINNFRDKRLMAEKNLSINNVPFLTDIYQNVLTDENMPQNLAEKIAELEWQLDFETIIPRNDTVEILRNLEKKGKKILIVTDSYYSSGQIWKILKKINISADDVFISCEHGTVKKNNLFDSVKSKYINKNIVHIGDDGISDIHSAEKAGISSIRIFSAYEMFEKCGYLGFEKYLDNYNSRLKLGLVISRLFNSPFIKEHGCSKISVTDCFDFGYCIAGEIISDFTLWFHNEMKEKSIDNIWFCARDGYLIKKLYSQVSDRKTVYFLTSRIAALRAGTESLEDIEYIDDMKFSGTEAQKMKMRYGLCADILDKNDMLDKCRKSRHNYCKYIKLLNSDSSEIAFFDFVAKGTSQMFVQRLVPNRITGFYFLKLPNNSELINEAHINSYIDTNNLKSSSIYEDYYILEPILTSPEPSVIDFNDNGDPVYAKETRTEAEIQVSENIQEGIENYFHDYIKLSIEPQKRNDSALGENLLSLVHRLNIKDNPLLNMNVEDMFFNRSTSIKSLI